MADGAPVFEQQVAALMQAGTYPVRVNRIRAVPTHMARVFLTEHHAWKLRRPRHHGRIDFHSRQARLKDAVQEWRLDAFFAPGVCLGIAGLQQQHGHWILRSPGAGRSLAPDDFPGEPVVWMRRLPSRGFMDQMIRSGRLRPWHIRALLTRFAALHGQRPRSEISAENARELTGRRRDAVLHALRRPIYGQNRALLAELAVRLRASADRQAPLIAHRIRSGRMRDGHGDLRPEHVGLEGAWARQTGPLFIDALEFDASLRQLDGMDEVAGLSVECDFLGAPWVSEQMRADWLARDGLGSGPLWAHFAANRALTRSLHAAWHLSRRLASGGHNTGGRGHESNGQRHDSRAHAHAPGAAAAPQVDPQGPTRDWSARAHQWLLLAREHLRRAQA